MPAYDVYKNKERKTYKMCQLKLILCISCNSDFFPQFSIYAGQKCLPKLTFSHLSQITIPFLHAITSVKLYCIC